MALICSTQRRNTLLMLPWLLLPLLPWASDATAAASCKLSRAHQYIERFIQYVRWPNEAQDDPWSICIVGDSAQAASDYAGAQVRGRTFYVIEVTTPEQTTSCHVLDLTGADEADQIAYLQHLRGMSVLTVGRETSFCRRGGQICLTQDSAHQFELNFSAIQTSGLQVNARLLRLGRGSAGMTR